MLSRISVNRPVFVTVVFIVILILGFLSYKSLTFDMMPDITMPSLTVVTIYPGAGAEDVEKRVTNKVEEAISTISSVDKIQSSSTEGVSTVSVTFVWGTNLDEAANDIRSKLDFISRDLPEDAEKPMILKFDTSMMPVLSIGVSAKESSEDLYYIVKNKISDPLARVPGVGMVTFLGGKEKQLRIELSPDKMAKYHIDIDQVIGAIKASNLSFPLGKITTGENEYVLRIPSEFGSTDDVLRVSVGNYQGRTIFVKDIASVVFEPNPNPDSYFIIKGSEGDVLKGAVLIVNKKSGANTVEVVKNVRKFIDKEIKPNLPKDVKLWYVMDSSEFIVNSLKNLGVTLIWGFVLVMIVVFLFLGEWGGSLTIALTIPLSLVVALIYLYFSGGSINIITLSALSIALGMVVDNAIVVMENIHRLREKGSSAKWAAEKGANEVASPILASTLTTIAIFVPILFITGFVRVMFEPLAFTISVVLLGSLFVSLTLTPMLSTFLWKSEGKKERKIFSKIQKGYEQTLRWAIHNPWKTILISVLIFALSIPLFLITEKSFMPETDTSHMIGVMEMDYGSSLENTKEAAYTLLNRMHKEIPEIEIGGVSVGSMGGMATLIGLREGSNIGIVRAKLKPRSQRKLTSKQVSIKMVDLMNTIPGVRKASFMSTDAVMTSMGMSKQVSVEIYGYDLDKMKKFADELKSKMDQNGDFVNTDISLETGAMELHLFPKYDLIYSYGVLPYSLSMYLRTMYNGTRVGVYRYKGEEYDIVLSLPADSVKNIEDVENLQVPIMMGKSYMPLKNLVNIEKRTGPVAIEHINKERVVKVESDLNVPLSKGERDIKKILKSMKIPYGIRVKLAGSIESQRESFSQLFIAFLMGALLVYLVMAAQFESFRDPFIIMFSVPFAFTGVTLLIYLSGLEFSVMSYVGLIMLVGIVVNNAIVLIDAILKLQHNENATLVNAILEAGRRRFRPVLMTATTTLFGILPMTIMNVEGAEMWKPLGFAVVGGIAVSTIVTLVLVPTIFYLFNRKNAT